MSFTSPSFVLLILAIVLLTNAFPKPRARSWILLVGSSLFVASHVNRPVELAPFGLFLLFGYGWVELLRRTRSRAALTLGLMLLLGGFVLLKRYSFLSPSVRLPFDYLVVGLSYVLFRLIHLMVDAQQGELAGRLPVLSFTNYCVCFLTFTAGPIQLYPEFSEQEQQGFYLNRADWESGARRLVRGFVKVGVVSAVLNYVFVATSTKLLGPGAWGAGAVGGAWLASAALYTTYLYANFAGYMDIVIGVGSLCGLRLPENFDAPFAARNFLELWSRWHMTLSSWFKIYLFNPLLKSLAKRFSSARISPYLAVIAFFVTFLVMGVWHGTTSVFVVYGLFLGAGASVNKLWQVFLSQRLGKRAYKEWCERPSVLWLSRGATFAYFALALTCLWVDLAQLELLVLRVGAAGVMLVYVALALGAALALFAGHVVSAQGKRVWKRVELPFKLPLSHELALAAQILLVVSVGSFFHKAPEFVYRAF